MMSEHQSDFDSRLREIEKQVDRLCLTLTAELGGDGRDGRTTESIQQTRSTLDRVEQYLIGKPPHQAGILTRVELLEASNRRRGKVEVGILLAICAQVLNSIFKIL